jgi:hypothetical protein
LFPDPELFEFSWALLVGKTLQPSQSLTVRHSEREDPKYILSSIIVPMWGCSCDVISIFPQPMNWEV